MRLPVLAFPFGFSSNPLEPIAVSAYDVRRRLLLQRFCSSAFDAKWKSTPFIFPLRTVQK
jgi:hypothetical protein